MAEAGAETASSSARFFCHKCNVEITPRLPEYVCPRCNNGFIEELERAANDSDSDDSSSDAEMEPYDVWDMIAPDSAPGGASSSHSSSAAAGSANQGPRRSQRLRHLSQRRRRFNTGDRHSALAPLIHDLIMHMTTGVIEASVGGGSAGLGAAEFPGGPPPPVTFDWPGFPVLVASNLASNPGDYAWGRGGLDAIITQLMNQLDGTGPPPLNKDQISQIPTASITKDQCDKGLQCSVCMEDFTVEETVRRLYCEHCFHNDCIIPWLELHGTCPICRKLLLEDGQPILGAASGSGGNTATSPGSRRFRNPQAGPNTSSLPDSSSTTTSSSSFSSSTNSSSSSSTSTSSSSSSSASNSSPTTRSGRPMFEEELD